MSVVAVRFFKFKLPFLQDLISNSYCLNIFVKNLMFVLLDLLNLFFFLICILNTEQNCKPCLYPSHNYKLLELFVEAAVNSK